MRPACTYAALVGLILLLPTQALADDDVDKTTYELKLGFIPGTKPDVGTGFMTVDEAKLACEKKADCRAFTFKAAPDIKEKVHIYMKEDSTVAETDKTWSSYIKRPAGLMDVEFRNDLAYTLELCWIDMIGSAAPACYGSVAGGGGTKNLSSFAGHNFVLKRLVWSLPASAATAKGTDAGGGGATIAIAARQRGHEWESLATSGPADADAASTTAATTTLTATNMLTQPAEVCSAPLWASRLLQGPMPAGLEACHGVVAAGGTLSLPSVPADHVLLARQLVGVATIQKRVPTIQLQEQALSAETMRRMVNAMKGAAGGGGAPRADGRPPPAPPPAKARPAPPPARKPPGSPDALPHAWDPLLPYLIAGSPAARACTASAAKDAAMGAALAAWASSAASAIDGGRGTPLDSPLSDALHLLGVTPGASKTQANGAARESVYRMLRAVRRLAPRLAAAVAQGGAAGRVVVSVALPPPPLPSANDPAYPAWLEPHALALHVALAMGLGGVRAVTIRLVPGLPAEWPPLPVHDAYAAAACAIGVDLSVSSAEAAALPPPHVLLFTGEAGMADWQVASTHAVDTTLVLGLRWIGPGEGSYAGGAHAYVSSHAHALAWHLASDAVDMLGGVPCATCDDAAHALLASSCDLRTYYERLEVSVGESTAGAVGRVVNAVMEAAAGATGGRLADRCDDMAELLGVTGEARDGGVADGVRALCRAHGCVR